jgi:DNA-binding transcriptional MerR regulator
LALARRIKAMLKVNNEEQAKLYEKRLEKVTKKLEEKLASMKTHTEKLTSAEKLARKSSKLVEELEKTSPNLQGFFNFQRDWRVYQQLQVVEKD